MQFFSFPSLPSTSDYAKELLAKGVVPPFVVRAHEQSKGRGQSSRSWISPEGGIYLSIVLKPQKNESICLAPLQTAILIARWFRKILGVHVTIKWPNDVLFQGRKLAGILCESSIQNNNFGPLIVGIGINVQPISLPQAISLQEISRLNWDVETIANNLSTFFMQSWDFMPIILDDPLLNPKGWLWWNENLGFLHHRGLTRNGQLKLSHNLTDPPELVITSNAQYDLKWIYQYDCPKRFPVLLFIKSDEGIIAGCFAENYDQHPTFTQFICAENTESPSELEKVANGLFQFVAKYKARQWPVFATIDGASSWLSEFFRERGMNLICTGALSDPLSIEGLLALKDRALGYSISRKGG